MVYITYHTATSKTAKDEDEMTLARNYVTITQAAELLKVNRATIRRWIEEGRMSAETIGRERLIPREEINWLEGVPNIEMVLAAAAVEDLAVGDFGGARFAPSGYGAAQSKEQTPRYLTMLADGRRKVIRVRLEEVEDITDKW